MAEDEGGLTFPCICIHSNSGSVDVNMTAPELGETLYWDQIVDFTYSANASVTTYLEVDGMIPGRAGSLLTALISPRIMPPSKFLTVRAGIQSYLNLMTMIRRELHPM